MYRLKFVIVFLCLINLAELRYYKNSNDPSAIAFEGPTNFDTRQTSENEVEENYLDLINVRNADIGAPVEVYEEPSKPPKDGTGFFFPDK